MKEVLQWLFTNQINEYKYAAMVNWSTSGTVTNTCLLNCAIVKNHYKYVFIELCDRQEPVEGALSRDCRRVVRQVVCWLRLFVVKRSCTVAGWRNIDNGDMMTTRKWSIWRHWKLMRCRLQLYKQNGIWKWNVLSLDVADYYGHEVILYVPM